MMTDTPENNKSGNRIDVTSYELIAEAYAAIKLSERDYDLPKPTGPPLLTKNTPDDKPADSSKTLRASNARSESDSRSEHPQSLTTRTLTESPPFAFEKPPAPTGSPVAPMIRSSRNTLTTSSDTPGTDFSPYPNSQSFSGSQANPGTRTNPRAQSSPALQRPQTTHNPRSSRIPKPSPPKQNKKSNGLGTLLAWIAIIIFLFWVLPYLRIFD